MTRGVDISRLPKSLQRKPELRALSLSVIPMRDGRVIVSGSEYGYEFRPRNGVPDNCTCQAFRSRHFCAHYKAQKDYLESMSESTRKDKPNGV